MECNFHQFSFFIGYLLIANLLFNNEQFTLETVYLVYKSFICLLNQFINMNKCTDVHLYY